MVEEVVQGWLLQIGKAEQRRREDLVGRALDRLADFHQFTATVPLLRYTEIAQGIFTNLTIGRGSRSRNDLRIAAICIAHGVPLLSRNVADFYDLPDLQLIPWQ